VKSYNKIRSAILKRLEDGLSPDLFYHSVDHTIDVVEQSERIAIAEKIHSEEEIYLLKVASLFHDSGFLFTYVNHELMGCKIAEETLPAYGVTAKELKIIHGLIMATCIPQSPKTKLEEIICDADLDYLGRNDFFKISSRLFEELTARNILKSEMEWNKIQVKFFGQHSYFTQTNKILRAPKKQVHLEMIEETILKSIP
jgi:uncharacterized protein